MKISEIKVHPVKTNVVNCLCLIPVFLIVLFANHFPLNLFLMEALLEKYLMLLFFWWIALFEVGKGRTWRYNCGGSRTLPSIFIFLRYLLILLSVSFYALRIHNWSKVTVWFAFWINVKKTLRKKCLYSDLFSPNAGKC